MTAITYRKTKTGEWVVFGPRAAMWDTFYNAPKGSVVVTKKDGSQKTERIRSIGRTFVADGTECCYGYIDRSAGAPRSTAASRDLCDECGKRRAVTTAYDLSGIPGRVCGRCKQDEGSLSFA